MVLILNRKVLLSICVVILVIICCFIKFRISPSKIIIAGGNLHSSMHIPDGTVPVVNQQVEKMDERFTRPSKELPYPNPYSFKDFRKEDETPPLVTEKFNDPEILILAYYGILQDASNMVGYSGGCGTIGMSRLPYPYAYELLIKQKQKEMSLDQFIDSFEGIGHITLLKVAPAYAPTGTPSNIKYYMVEIEVITGVKANTDEEYNQGSQFAYYYGLITVEKTPGEGWKIKDINYIPEDFLCAPMHGWFYFSDAVVQIVYGDNLKLIDEIVKTEQEGDMLHIYASGAGKNYRFDFIRLTNGYDIFLHENILKNGVWKETSLLTDKWEYLKLTIGSLLNKE
jgi:hypothetical protein